MKVAAGATQKQDCTHEGRAHVIKIFINAFRSPRERRVGVRTTTTTTTTNPTATATALPMEALPCMMTWSGLDGGEEETFILLVADDDDVLQAGERTVYLLNQLGDEMSDDDDLRFLRAFGDAYAARTHVIASESAEFLRMSKGQRTIGRDDPVLLVKRVHDAIERLMPSLSSQQRTRVAQFILHQRNKIAMRWAAQYTAPLKSFIEEGHR